MNESQSLIETIKRGPHWRIRVHPARFKPMRIKELSECWAIIERNRLNLRGWPYPYVPRDTHEAIRGNDYVAAQCSWEGHQEYWRFLQSAQFAHLLTVTSATNPSYRKHLQDAMGPMLALDGFEGEEDAQGYVDVLDLLFTVTQVFEFAVRLCLREVYTDALVLDVELANVDGFILGFADPLRAWHGVHRCHVNTLEHPTIETSPTELIGDHPGAALRASRWFFERFGWHDAPEEILRKDQARLLSGFRE